MVDILASNTCKANTYEFLINKINRDGILHFSLIDPDPTKQNPSKAGKMALYAEQAGTDAILIGGSTVFDQTFVDETVLAIKENVSLPIIIFPGGVANVSKHADAILFMSILNSEDPYFIVGQQAIASYTVKLSNLEIISTGYLIIEPGGTAGWISKAKLLPRNKPKLTTAYALAAEYFGFKFIYLEAGSGSEIIPAEIIRLCSSLLSIPIIVGGGVSSKEDARTFVEAGADVIVMGTFLENQVLKDNGNSLKTIIDEIKDAGKKNNKNYCLK
ncbi:MAG: geranylgeranylglyceryl/heptaprenylglyceryl phosphate synthase [Candidatus Lokiarchaeota archaeon]|nr:geranylgeranylglyceryl/heptaprenylglyceryl phosphate synthase [Candidatus Lokiarchaeota archaeon]